MQIALARFNELNMEELIAYGRDMAESQIRYNKERCDVVEWQL